MNLKTFLQISIIILVGLALLGFSGETVDKVAYLVYAVILLSIVLSRLKKFGWLDLTLNPEDSRKRLYKLKDPAEAIKEVEK